MERRIEKEVVVPASPADVWEAWTASDGVATFFAPRARIQLRTGGAYELVFDPDAPPGSRGSEGCRVLAYIPEELLGFEWNVPSEYPEVRRLRTFEAVRLEALPRASVGDRPAVVTLVRLSHLGWREGGQWDEVYRSFDPAWWTVLARLRERFAHGPIDWDDPCSPPVRTAGGDR